MHETFVQRSMGMVHQPSYTRGMGNPIEFEQEVDGRWIAEIPSLPGVMAYGASKAEAKARVETIAAFLSPFANVWNDPENDVYDALG